MSKQKKRIKKLEKQVRHLSTAVQGLSATVDELDDLLYRWQIIGLPGVIDRIGELERRRT